MVIIWLENTLKPNGTNQCVICSMICFALEGKQNPQKKNTSSLMDLLIINITPLDGKQEAFGRSD